MRDIEKILEFDKVKEQLTELAYTENAKEKIRTLEPCMSELELSARLRETSEAKLLLEKAGRPPITTMEGIGELITTAHQGGCLTAEQLEYVGLALVAVKRLKDYLNQCKQYESGLPYYEEELDSMEDVRRELAEKIRGGRVDDYASKLLRSLRAKIEQTSQKMREKADTVLRANKTYMSDHFSTVRNGHVCLPVKKEYKL